MNLTVHMVRSDLVRMRVWIACWVGILLLPIVNGAMLLAASPLQVEGWNLSNRAVILTGLQGIVAYVLTILLMHEHSVVGTRQFWLTRPISRARLLGSKFVGVFLIVALLPVVVSLPWWLWCGFGASHIASVAAETVLVMMLIALPAALMAVLTDSFPRALLWTVVLVALLLHAMVFVTIVNAATVRSAREFSLVISRSVVAVVAVALVTAAVVVVQYFVRRRGWWLGAAGVLLLLVVFGSTRWPWAWTQNDPRERHAERAAKITLRFDGAIAEPLRVKERKPGQELFQRIETQFTLRGIPQEFALTGMGTRHRWSWENGTNVERAEHLWFGFGPVEALGLRWPTHAQTEQWLADKLKARSSLRPAPDDRGVDVSVWIQPSTVARMRTESPRFDAQLWWQLLRPELSFEIPLARSRWMARDGRGLRVERIEREPTSTTVVTVETRPVTIRSLLTNEASQRSWFRDFQPGAPTALVAIDRTRGEIIDIFGSDHGGPSIVVINGVEIIWRARAALGRQERRDGKIVHQPVQIDNASLGVLTMHEEASFSREVKLERFEISGEK